MKQWNLFILDFPVRKIEMSKLHKIPIIVVSPTIDHFRGIKTIKVSSPLAERADHVGSEGCGVDLCRVKVTIYCSGQEIDGLDDKTN